MAMMVRLVVGMGGGDLMVWVNACVMKGVLVCTHTHTQIHIHTRARAYRIAGSAGALVKDTG